MEKNIQDVSWEGWETVRLIGSGSFGSVFEVQRKTGDKVEKAAIKKISIPQNYSDIEEMYNEGYDAETITCNLDGHLHDIIAEYTLMREMRDCINIVSCDDIKYEKHSDGMGWDVYIRMELLKPLTKWLAEDVQVVSDETVEKLANDMCNALKMCKKHNVVHRDIKPQNIFVSDNGDFKLGDFGIAKTMEKTIGGTKIGTYKYMAPEVYNNQPYGHSADIYSLGLVLYWVLNERRMPFMPLPPEKPKANSEEESRTRRFAGEPLPAPVNGSDKLKGIVLKACAYHPNDRYKSADEMLAMLVSKDLDIHRTICITEQEAQEGCVKNLAIEENRNVDITILAGVDNGTILRLPGEGKRDIDTGKIGDAIIRIQINLTEDKKNKLLIFIKRIKTKLELQKNDLFKRKGEKDEKKKSSKLKIIVIVLVIVLLVILLFEYGWVLFDLFDRPNTGEDEPSISTEQSTKYVESTSDTDEDESTEPESSTDESKDIPIEHLYWSEWLDELPKNINEKDYDVEKRTLYSSREQKTTSSTETNKMAGWELYDTVEAGAGYGSWSDWTDKAISETTDRQVESQTFYRYRTKETTTSQSSTMSGWTRYDTKYYWSDYGSWSDWSTTAVSSSDSRKVETKTQYRYRDISYSTEYTNWSNWSDWTYYRQSTNDLKKEESRTVWGYYYFKCPNCGAHMHGWNINCPTWAGGCGAYIPESAWNQFFLPVSWESAGFKDWHGTGKYYAIIDGQRYFKWNDANGGTRTQYRYATRETKQVANYGSWSGWGDTAYSNSSTREVQTRTLYRYCTRSQYAIHYFYRWGNWSNWYYDSINETSTRQVESKKFYRYRDQVKVKTYYFRKWTEWSEYSTGVVTPSETVQVNTKTQYRFKAKTS